MSYELGFTDKARADIDSHKKRGNKAVLNKLHSLLEELADHPYEGTGKPEPLKYRLTGCWSRRINRVHRRI